MCYSSFEVVSQISKELMKRMQKYARGGNQPVIIRRWGVCRKGAGGGKGGERKKRERETASFLNFGAAS